MASSSSCTNPDDVFAEVRERFLKDLPPTHHLRVLSCISADALLQDVRTWDIITRNKQRGSRYLSGLKKLTDNLSPFFRVIDLVVNSHPEYASIAWGSINLALQLASNFVSFFEKLNKTLDRITRAFPAYGEIERIVKANRLPLSVHVKKSLGRVYQDILSFLHEVVEIFAKPDGQMRKTPRVLGALAFKSFDTRFESVLSDLRDDRKLLELEIGILKLGLTQTESQQTRQELARAMNEEAIHATYVEEKLKANYDLLSEVKAEIVTAHAEATLHGARTWISAPEFASELEDSFRHREDGTCNWIFDNKSYENWRDAYLGDLEANIEDELGPGALWIHGAPGSGKTVLAATVIDDLLDECNGSNDQAMVLYHFFKDSSGWAEPTAAYRAMLAQILHRNRQDPALVNKFSFAMWDVSSGQKSATLHELLDLLKMCLGYLGQAFIVLDGIDECTDPETLLEDLMQFGCAQAYKLLFLSRLNVSPLLRQVPEWQRITMSNGGVSDDIQLYARRKLEIMKRQMMFPNEPTLTYLTDQLVKGSGHMFLWARLMLMYLKSPALTPKQRLKTVDNINLPEGLEPMYLRMLGLIAQAPECELHLAMTIFTWLAGARREISEVELQEAIRIVLDCDDDDGFENFRHTVIMVCCGFVEPSSSIQNNMIQGRHIQFVHLSARDMILSLQPGNNAVPDRLQPYLQTTQELNLQIASVCLRYLAHKMPRSPLSGQVNKAIDLKYLMAQYPLASYASIWWIEHLVAGSGIHYKDSMSSSTCKANDEDLLFLLDTWFAKPLAIMAWIEASYFCQRASLENSCHSGRIERLMEWCEFKLCKGTGRIESLSSVTIQACKEFCTDLLLLDQMMGTGLGESPELIWDEAPAFVPSRFWIASSATSVSVLDPTGANGNGTSKQPLITISNSSLARYLIGVLAVWSSNDFEDFWVTIDDSICMGELHSYCQGWTAGYQVYSVAGDKPTMVLETHIALQAEEVWLAIHQSLRKEANKNWRFHFPLTISENLQSFIILQTFYTANPSKHNGMVTMNFANLNLEQALELNSVWWELQKRPPTPHTTIERGGPHDMGTYYTYKMKISSDGRLLYFSDYHQFQKSTLAILEISDTGSSNVLGKCESSPTWDEEVVVFHPSAPLLFIYRDRVVFVWNYTQCQSLEEFYNPRCGYHDGLQEMNISSCGKYLVMCFPGNGPMIQSIQPHLQATRRIPEVTALANCINEQPSIQDSLSLFKHGQVLQGLDLQIHDNGSYQSLFVSQTPTSVDVSRWKQDQNSDAGHAGEQLSQQRLTMLPAWTSIENTRVSVRWPAEKERMVKIVMNQVSRKHYSHATAQTANAGPVVIQRDTRALRAPESSFNSSGSRAISSVKRKDSTTILLEIRESKTPCLQ